MIPRSLTLRGFLCYKDEQVVDLDGCDLWILAGRNGSGKSAVFDAMTFALFGAHRGGKRDAASLINTDSDELTVVFEFELGPGRYRIRRNLRRKGQVALHVARFEPEDGGPGRWPVVPETETAAGLKRWVQENVGLTYETFTASVLLLQGHSESLLGAEPRERHRILAGIVDLESYLRLHKRADERRQLKRVQAEHLRSRLRAAPLIEPEAIARAEHQWSEADAARAVAEVEWKRLVELRAQAATWLDLAGRHDRASAAREHARRLLADSDAIARDWARLQDLEGTLPAIRRATSRRQAMAQLEEQSRGGEDERKALTLELDAIAGLVEQNRQRLETLADEIGRDLARDRAIFERQAALAIPIHRASQSKARREDVHRIEAGLASYPRDLAERVAGLEGELRLRDEWKAALPTLSTLARERKKLADSQARRLAAGRAIEAGGAEASRAEAELAGRRSEESAARGAEGRARDRAIEAATLARAARDRLAQLDVLDGRMTCDRCGQALTPEHLASESTRLREERDRVSEAADAAGREHLESQRRLDDAESARSEAERSLREANEAVEAASRDLAQAGRDAEHHALACLEAYERLDGPFRARVAPLPPDDWAATTFPDATDLDEGRRLAAEIEGIRSRFEAERARLDRMESDRVQLEQARRALDAIGLQPGDEAAEAEHAALQAERATLARCLEGHATEKAAAERDRAKLDGRGQELRARLHDAERRLTAARTRLEALRDEASRARADIPEGWRDAFDTAGEADLAPWDAEIRTLRTRGLDVLAAELPQARLRLEQAEADLIDLDRRIAALPEDARRPPDAIAVAAEAAERALAQAVEECRARRGALDKLRSDRDGRLDLASRALAADRDLAVAETLARLLGPRGLQRDLIRDAERGIVGFANPILRELSGGELELRLIEAGDDEPDLALQLEAIERVQGRTGARGVEYLSGSQKFRVAVSLALAIGQYARGGKERPIESVIIDEGFGCLDRQGRDEMIEQLNALRGRLARIILVSHQEEFAEAFTDGYRFQVVDGSTVVQPFHR